MKTFEVTGSGFDASNSDTDDRVFWVKALSQEDVTTVIEGLDASFHGEIGCQPGDGDIDFTLPGDAASLQAALRELFVRRYVPSAEYVFGSYYLSRRSGEPFKTVTVMADDRSRAEALAIAELKPAINEFVRWIETRPNPLHMAQVAQQGLWYADQDAKRREAVLLERASAPILRLSLGLEVRDGRSMPYDEDWIAWIRTCLNCNTNRVVAHVALAEGDRTEPNRDATRTEMDVDIRLNTRDGKPVPDLLAWVSACLNCNTNHVVAEVSMREQVREASLPAAERQRA